MIYRLLTWLHASYLHGNSPLPWIMHAKFIKLNNNNTPTCVVCRWKYPVLIGGYIYAKHHRIISKVLLTVLDMLTISNFQLSVLTNDFQASDSPNMDGCLFPCDLQNLLFCLIRSVINLLDQLMTMGTRCMLLIVISCGSTELHKSHTYTIIEFLILFSWWVWSPYVLYQSLICSEVRLMDQFSPALPSQPPLGGHLISWAVI